MSRKWQIDGDDETCLPPGMKRVGYDADTQTYTFRDSDGSYWTSASEYGTMYRVRESDSIYQRSEDVDSYYATMNREGHSHSRKARPLIARWMDDQTWGFWKYFGPFMLLISVVLLLAFRFLFAGPSLINCREGLDRYFIGPGDTCWKITQGRDIDVKELLALNPNLDCDRIWPGDQICVPTLAPAAG